MAKRRKPLTCKVCGKKFSYSAKTNPFGRMSKHMWKDHKEYMKKKQRAGKKKAKQKNYVRPLDREFMAIDDLLLSNALGGSHQSQQYDPIHEQLGGLILKALLPIVVEGIAKSIQKKRAKKK
ncbi:hypothetical protein ES705_38006 [subsurface metagenome]